jgi:hypothetical protein
VTRSGLVVPVPKVGISARTRGVPVISSWTSTVDGVLLDTWKVTDPDLGGCHPVAHPWEVTAIDMADVAVPQADREVARSAATITAGNVRRRPPLCVRARRLRVVPVISVSIARTRSPGT